jgi:hypothetical protein
MGKYQRTKGHNFERQTARDMQKIGYPDAKRNLEYQEGTGIDVTDCDPYIIQCKVGKNPPIKQAYLEMPDLAGKIRVVRARWDRGLDLAVMSWGDFMEIIRK